MANLLRKTVRSRDKMPREYNFDNEANFGFDCHRCGKEIKRLPCKMVTVNDVEDWVYFHMSCFKRFKHEQKG